MDKKILMTQEEIKEAIAEEDRCGVNTLLQDIFSCSAQRYNVYKIINDKGQIEDYIVCGRNNNGRTKVNGNIYENPKLLKEFYNE